MNSKLIIHIFLVFANTTATNINASVESRNSEFVVPSLAARFIKAWFIRTQISKFWYNNYNVNPFRDYHWENIYLTTDDKVNIGMWVYRVPKPKRCIIYLHGTGRNRIYYTKYFGVHKFFEAGYNVVIPDYRAFGDSTGEYDIQKVSSDIKKVHKYCLKNGLGDPVLVGHSLGGAVALEYCKDFEFKNKVVLISTFLTSSKALNDYCVYRWFRYLFPHVQKDLDVFFNYDSRKNMSCLKPSQVLVVHGKSDWIINWKHASELTQTNQHYPPRFFEGEGHRSILNSDGLIDVIEEFLEREDDNKN